MAVRGPGARAGVRVPGADGAPLGRSAGGGRLARGRRGGRGVDGASDADEGEVRALGGPDVGAVAVEAALGRARRRRRGGCFQPARNRRRRPRPPAERVERPVTSARHDPGAAGGERGPPGRGPPGAEELDGGQRTPVAPRHPRRHQPARAVRPATPHAGPGAPLGDALNHARVSAVHEKRAESAATSRPTTGRPRPPTPTLRGPSSRSRRNGISDRESPVAENRDYRVLARYASTALSLTSDE